MRQLTVLFDPDCGLCGSASDWLGRQRTLVPLELIPAGSPTAIRRFPELTPERTSGELTVVADDRLVYRGDRAFVMCLWAVERTRSWSLSLGAAGDGALARRFFRALSTHRHALSRLLWKRRQERTHAR
jgi:predicted DCC family thiol-disulfide oxidoreductase YuxK